MANRPPGIVGDLDRRGEGGRGGGTPRHQQLYHNQNIFNPFTALMSLENVTNNSATFQTLKPFFSSFFYTGM